MITHAGVPVLADQSKVRPTVTRAASRAGTSQPVILGTPGTISQAKRRPSGRSFGNLTGLDLLGRCVRKIKGHISARSVVIMDAHTGEILYSRAGTRPRNQPAPSRFSPGSLPSRVKNHDTAKVSRYADPCRVPRSTCGQADYKGQSSSWRGPSD